MLFCVERVLVVRENGLDWSVAWVIPVYVLSKRQMSPYVVLYECKHSVLYAPFNSGCGLSQGLVRFEDLRELDLSENDILYLPPFVGQLSHLTVLNMSRNSERTNIPTCLPALICLWLIGKPC